MYTSFNLLILVQGLRWPNSKPTAQGAKWEPSLRGCPFAQDASYMHQTHLAWDNVDKNLMCTSLEWKKTLELPGEPKQIREDPSRYANSSQRLVPIGDFFFLSYQCYNEMTLDKTLFKNLLYIHRV